MIPSSPNHDLGTNDLLRRLAVAAWGVCCGVLLASISVATLIAINGDTQDPDHAGILPSNLQTSVVRVPWQERYERIWYMLTCVCGALGGFAASRFVRLTPWLATVAVLGFIPLITPACASTFSANPDVWQFLLAAGILAIPPLVALARGARAEQETSVVAPSCSTRRTWLTAAFLCLPLGGLLYGLFAPYDLHAVATDCYTEAHVVSYLVGPALYYRDPAAVPGLDFESHYGLGHAYTFSLVMGHHGLDRMMERYVVFVVVVAILYFLSAFLVLTDWLRNPWIAFGVTLALVTATGEGMTYHHPSSWPVRHPFVFVFVFCAVRGTESTKWCIAAGAVAGISLFWQTDIGLYTLAAGCALLLANALFLRGSWRNPLLFLAVGVMTFFTLCLASFGPRVLSGLFIARVFEPLLLYGTGFGNQLLNWHSGWSHWYNLAGPGIAIASVSMWLGYRREATPPRAVVYSAAASLLGLAMLFKWVNRSIDVLWALNGGLVIAVAGCWLWLAWQALSKRLASETCPRLGYLRQSAVAAMLLALVVLGVWWDRETATSPYQGGSSSPLVRIANRIDSFPNTLNHARKGLELAPRANPLDTDTITYLKANTRKTERVAVLHWLDWNYLAEAGRPPQLHWLPLFYVHSPTLLDRCADDLRHADRVFAHPAALDALSRLNPMAHERIAQVMNADFGPPEETPCEWVIYRRKPGPVAQR